MNSLLVLIQSLFLIIVINFQLSLCADVVEHANCSQPITCGNAETKIVYPFWGANRAEYCGKSGFEVKCQSDIPIISMKNVDYRILEFTDETTGNRTVKVARNDYWETICPSNYTNTSVDLALFYYTAGFQNISFFYNCNSTGTSTSPIGSSATTSKVCNATVSVSYLTKAQVDQLPENPFTNGACEAEILIPVSDSAAATLGTNSATIQDAIDGGFELDVVNSDADLCSSCEASGGACGVDNSTSTLPFRCFCQQTSNSTITCPSPTNSSSSSGVNVYLNFPLIIAAVSATAIFIVIIVSCILWKKTTGKERKRKKYSETINNIGRMNEAELTFFSIKSVIAATNNFSEANKLGEGGFGPVYKGILTDNQEVAMKRLSKKSGQGHQEFMNELKLIAKLQHTNLVRILGCCIEDEEMILIYEYLPNRSLDKYLFGYDPSGNINLDWGQRFRIIEGIAQGVLYIHKHSRLKIIHRDLKASNVLLDEEMNPKISDFGMAKIFEVNQTEANTNRVVGTYGYMSPEYARYGHFSEKLDVFSFGVLLLEIVSGKRNGAFYHFENSPTLAGWAWKLWKGGRGLEVIDESLRETCRSNEVLICINVAFLCVQESPTDRPTMSTVIHMLQANEYTSLPSSKEPAFSTYSNSNVIASSPISTRFSNNALTISTLVGR